MLWVVSQEGFPLRGTNNDQGNKSDIAAGFLTLEGFAWSAT